MTSKTKFPFLDLQAQYASIREQVTEAVHRVLESQRFIMGSEVEAFEREVAKEVGAQFAYGCASGSDALLLALMALGIGRDEEVITTPFTFVATAGAIARLGARPVFVDIEPDTFNLDPAQINKAITPRTKAIMPVHLFGLAADMDPILAIAAEHGLPVIEDAAQAIGAQYRGEPVGSLGTFGCFSFFPSKNLGGAGDGGLVTTNDPVLADRVNVLRLHGSRTKYRYELLGINSRLDAVQAAILRVKLPLLEGWAEGRRCNADKYLRAFAEERLAEVVAAPRCPSNRLHVYNQFTIRVAERDRLRQNLANSGIPTEIYYPEPLHLQPAFSYLGHKAGDFPEAEAAGKQVVSLPIYPELGHKNLQAVTAAITHFFKTRKGNATDRNESQLEA